MSLQIQTGIYFKEDSHMVTKQTMIGDLLRLKEVDDIVPVLLGIGMHCLGCPSSQMETIEQAAMVHGINPDELVDKLNAVINK